MRQKLSVLVVCDAPFPTPYGYDFSSDLSTPAWSAEGAVVRALRANGHTVSVAGLFRDTGVLFEAVRRVRPDVIFNLTEVLCQRSDLEKNAAYLMQITRVPYSGEAPAGLLVCNNKALSKKLLAFHGLNVPRFEEYAPGTVSGDTGLPFPVVVKPLKEEASRGIANASLVMTQKALRERVRFIHDRFATGAIVEEYIPGRELYASVLGGPSLRVFPLREMTFGRHSSETPAQHLATYRAKWDPAYRARWQIRNMPARKLRTQTSRTIRQACETAYRALGLRAYARFDLRLTASGAVYIIEANANPSLAPDDEFALSAARAGISYRRLIDLIVRLPLAEHARNIFLVPNRRESN